RERNERMIEVASFPRDLSMWDPANNPFYLELFGETRPTLDVTYAEVLPAGTTEGGIHTASASPVYEYWWTIGHPGAADDHRHWWWPFDGADRQVPWEHLDDIAARVYVYFPIDKDWRIK